MSYIYIFEITPNPELRLDKNAHRVGHILENAFSLCFLFKCCQGNEKKMQEARRQN